MDITAINAFLQGELALRNVDCVTAVEAARWLDSRGLLRDSATRRGKPLRDLLRGGRIIGQRQEANSHWFICRAAAYQPFATSGSTEPPIATAPAVTASVDALAEQLCEPTARVPAREWPVGAGDVRVSGLYTWWVDGSGTNN